MAIYKFRVTIDHEDTIFRDIEVQSNQSFMEFNRGIIEAFNLSECQEVIFLASDNNWHQGTELMVIRDNMVVFKEEKDKDGKAKKKNVLKPIALYVDDPHQHFICFIDSKIPLVMFIELMKINTDEPDEDEDMITYPRSVKSFGQAPKPVQMGGAIPVPVEDDEDENGERRIKAQADDVNAEEDDLLDEEGEPTDEDLEHEETELGLDEGDTDNLKSEEGEAEAEEGESAEEMEETNFDEFPTGEDDFI